jgi:hypothetical protein
MITVAFIFVFAEPAGVFLGNSSTTPKQASTPQEKKQKDRKMGRGNRQGMINDEKDARNKVKKGRVDDGKRNGLFLW